MALDIELYRRTVSVPVRRGTQDLRHISVIDIQPEGATQTLVFVQELEIAWGNGSVIDIQPDAII